MYEIIMQSFLCCFDFLIVLMLFHHFLLDRWEKSILGIIIKAISVLVCGVSLACINFFGVFWLNVIVAVILNLSMALSFYKGKLLVKFFLSVLVATLSIFFEFFVIILTSWIFGENLTMVIQIPTAKLAMTIISKVLLFIVIRIIFIFTYVFSAYKWCKRNVQRIDIAISLVFIKCLASIRMLNFCGGMKI